MWSPRTGFLYAHSSVGVSEVIGKGDDIIPVDVCKPQAPVVGFFYRADIMSFDA
jgi:hypothetical protein